MHLALVLALAASVEGIVTLEDPLPGCTVTLTNTAGAVHTTVTGRNGEYRLQGIEPGSYTLRFTLQGLETSERTVVVADGSNVLRTEEMFPEFDTVTTSCRVCATDPPETVWDQRTCADEDMDGLLAVAADQGDRSALQLLIQRHDSASTYEQKFEIAATLLRRVPDDRAYWIELQEHAANALRFARSYDEDIDPAYRQWCEERAIPEDRYELISWNALRGISSDPRSRPLLLEALRAPRTDIVNLAIHGFATQRDLAMLPAIEQALQAHPEDAANLAIALLPYESEAADQVAYRYLNDEYLESYVEERALNSAASRK